MSRRLRRADLRCVGDVRRALRELLREWGRPEAADVAELLTTELVTNALVHTDQGAEVTARLAGSRLRVEVLDHTAKRPEPLVPTADDGTHGRGLLLVQALADAWGVTARGTGKVVWFELGGTEGDGVQRDRAARGRAERDDAASGRAERGGAEPPGTGRDGAPEVGPPAPRRG
ncbi:ATP-binding protein [Streptomyces sp. NPDC093225]|uniref:ATP-binding protein n=1 Tax=Streptomyces sp. NPDC093225 TaxID=3366034 RepID=UPI003819EBE8